MAESTPSNIEAFNQVVAIILVKLYEAFPTKISLNSDKIGQETAEHFGLGRGEWDQIILEVAPGTIDFLIDEGFIDCSVYRTYSGSQFTDAKLTMKGLSLLGKIPGSVDKNKKKQTFADQLKNVVEDGAKESATDIVKQLFTYAVSLGATAAISM